MTDEKRRLENAKCGQPLSTDSKADLRMKKREPRPSLTTDRVRLPLFISKRHASNVFIRSSALPPAGKAGAAVIRGSVNSFSFRKPPKPAQLPRFEPQSPRQ